MERVVSKLLRTGTGLGKLWLSSKRRKKKKKKGKKEKMKANK
jgi:hypothetical protein